MPSKKKPVKPDPEPMQEKKSTKEEKERNFKGFVNTTLVNFMTEYKLEKLSIDDGRGNRAKISRDKYGAYNVETTVKEVL